MNDFVYHRLQEEMELLAIVEKEQEKEKKGIDIIDQQVYNDNR